MIEHPRGEIAIRDSVVADFATTAAEGKGVDDADTMSTEMTAEQANSEYQMRRNLLRNTPIEIEKAYLNELTQTQKSLKEKSNEQH